MSNVTKIKKVITDSAITIAVKAKFIEEKSLSALNIKVETKKGVVFLSGKVQSNKEITKAIEVAFAVHGVEDVDTSELKVEEESMLPLTDTIITVKVKGLFIREKIFGDKPLPVTKIHVETKDGVVFLTGKVADKPQVALAKKLAKEVNGVKEVKSSLEVE